MPRKPKTPEQKAAVSKATRDWQLRNPEQTQRIHYQSRYGIDFDEKWEAQQGLCAACGEPLKRGGQEFDSVCVDHDRACCPRKRSCGKCFRGLIHKACNHVLGYAQDDLHTLECAAKHLS